MYMSATTPRWPLALAHGARLPGTRRCGVRKAMGGRGI